MEFLRTVLSMLAAHRRPGTTSRGQLFGFQLPVIVALTALRITAFTMPTLRMPMLTMATLAMAMFTMLPNRTAQCAPLTHIAVDGDFDDWAGVTAYTDPNGAPGVLHNGVPDVHDTDQSALGGMPGYVNHPDVDILEYKFTHDEDNLYAYFKADGVIGNTQTAAQGRAGRYYVIVTIDVDNDNSTGYFLHEGGYFPTSGVDRYDMNMEAEYYDGVLNTAHYLSHDAPGSENGPAIRSDFTNLTVEGYVPTNVNNVDVPGPAGPYTPGFAQPELGNYDNYTQWVYHANDTLTHVQDRGPIVPGIMTVARSLDGHEIEISAPFKGFLKNMIGNPNMALGKTIDISFSLEASGELAPGNEWASDTANPIQGYFLDTYAGDFTFNGIVDSEDLNDPTDGWQVRFGADLDGSEFLDWQRNLSAGAQSLSALAKIPEPATVALTAVVAAAALLTRIGRWRKRV